MIEVLRTLVQLAVSLLCLIAAVAGLNMVNNRNHPPSEPAVHATASPSPSDGDCHVTPLASDGTPLAGSPQLDPHKLCDALANAEVQANCMDDWQPPERISARELCLEAKRHGCEPSGRDCTLIPIDQTYYYHR